MNKRWWYFSSTRNTVVTLLFATIPTSSLNLKPLNTFPSDLIAGRVAGRAPSLSVLASAPHDSQSSNVLQNAGLSLSSYARRINTLAPSPCRGCGASRIALSIDPSADDLTGRRIADTIRNNVAEVDLIVGKAVPDLGAGDAAGEIGGDSCAAGTVARDGGVAASGDEAGSRGVFCWGSYLTPNKFCGCQGNRRTYCQEAHG